MPDQCAELLAKGRDGRLSDVERDELARLLNAPLLDPLMNPSTGFSSKRSHTTSNLADRLRSIDWFAKCGQPLRLNLTMEVGWLANWADALESCSGITWENVQLEAQNQLTMWLHLHARERYQSWNARVSEFKQEVITPLLRTKWEPYQRMHQLDVSFAQCIESDALLALMEGTFRDTGHNCFFFHELLTVYETGHFPCGWVGEWPNGKLLVY